MQSLRKGITKQQGFTIVELLIVVVVIAILAAITIVAFNGVQQRARNAQTVTAVNAYLKGLSLYVTDNGSYPAITNASGAYACLGENNPGGLCWQRIANSNVQDPAFNSALRTEMGNKLPDVNTTLVGGRNGIMFVNHTNAAVTLDGAQYRYYMVYIMEGAGAKCPVGQLLSGAWATFTSTTPATGYTVDLSGAGTECWIKLPVPAA